MYSNILGIESSSERATVALRRTNAQQDSCDERFSEETNRHAENLLPLITELLSTANVDRRQLDAIAVGVGPGSFTGLRAGIALSVGLGLGLNVPVYGISSLTLLAGALASAAVGPSHANTAPELVGALLDARRGEFFFAAFMSDLTPVVAPCLVAGARLATDIATLTQGRSIWIAGQAAVAHLETTMLAPAAFYTEPSVLFPSASVGTRLLGTSHASLDPLPHYLREPDVKVPELTPNPLVSVD